MRVVYIARIWASEIKKKMGMKEFFIVGSFVIYIFHVHSVELPWVVTSFVLHKIHALHPSRKQVVNQHGQVVVA